MNIMKDFFNFVKNVSKKNNMKNYELAYEKVGKRLRRKRFIKSIVSKKMGVSLIKIAIIFMGIGIFLLLLASSLFIVLIEKHNEKMERLEALPPVYLMRWQSGEHGGVEDIFKMYENDMVYQKNKIK